MKGNNIYPCKYFASRICTFILFEQGLSNSGTQTTVMCFGSDECVCNWLWKMDVYMAVKFAESIALFLHSQCAIIDFRSNANWRQLNRHVLFIQNVASAHMFHKCRLYETFEHAFESCIADACLWFSVQLLITKPIISYAHFLQ